MFLVTKRTVLVKKIFLKRQRQGMGGTLCTQAELDSSFWGVNLQGFVEEAALSRDPLLGH